MSDKEAKMRRIFLPSCRTGLTAWSGVRLVHVYPWVVRVFLIVVLWIWMMALRIEVSCYYYYGCFDLLDLCTVFCVTDDLVLFTHAVVFLSA